MHVEKYKVGEIKEILEGIYNDKETRRTVVPLFMSESGLGKTQIIEEFMREKGVYRPPMVLSQRLPFEISGMAMIDKGVMTWLKPVLLSFNYFLKKIFNFITFKHDDSEDTFNAFLATLEGVDTTKMKYYDFDFLLELKDGHILFLDEVPNANPLTLNAFLTFLESRIMISGRKLPDIMIVAAGNWKGMPVFTAQVKRRFLWYNIEFDDVAFKDFFQKRFGLPRTIGAKLANLVRNETYEGYNFNSSADIDKAIGMIIKGIKTPYTKALKPILEELVENTYGETVILGTETWEVNEKKKWLDVMKLIYKENGTIN